MNRHLAPASLALASLALASLALPACGDNTEGIPKEILPEELYAARCEHPRSGIDPSTNQPYADVEGSLLDEKLWLRSWIDDLYLWYSEVPPVDITRFDKPTDYFDQLKTPAKTPSGKDKDQFHFWIPTDEWVAMSQGGVEAGYGLQWALLASRPPRKLLVAFSTPGSPAAMAGLNRGDEISKIDGVDVTNSNSQADIDKLNNGLFPATVGEQHTFEVLARGSIPKRTVTVTSQKLDLVPVQNVKTLPAPNNKVGYLLFTDHIATAEKALLDAITKLKSMQITDLILDMRYNGGGYLAVASELAYMIAGPTATRGKTFEQLTFNDKHTIDPSTGKPFAPDPFLDRTLGLAPSLDPGGTPLPSLGLSRVFILTGSGTCSASESVMNSLAGIDIDVIQIGETTCGKPYGFLPADNCGTTYFAIQFKGVNNKGFGDYADGFSPGKTASGPTLKGCTVSDDFSHALGDPAETRLSVALTYRNTNGTCGAGFQERSAQRSAEPILPKSAWRQNRILRR